MLEFKHADNFYDLESPKAIKLVGKHFRETNLNFLCFPVRLSAKQFNYGRNPGLILVSPIIGVSGAKRFKVGAYSPDDLDCDLEYDNRDIKLDFRNNLIEYLRELQLKKKPWTYKGFLQAVLDKFPGGKLYC